MDKHKFTCGVFIDLKKAFDTVDHEILLKKLWQYGIRGIANDWFKSNPTNRIQYVSIEEIWSDPLKVFFGALQGSVHGPWFFPFRDDTGLP